MASGGRRRRRAVPTLAAARAERGAPLPLPAPAPPWWPSSASAWPTRSTARTSRSAATSPRPRGRRRRRRRRSGPGCWRSSSSWCADQPFSRSSRVSGWACEGARRQARRLRPPENCNELFPLVETLIDLNSLQQLLENDVPHWPYVIPGPFTSHSEFSSPCHSALRSTTCIKQ